MGKSIIFFILILSWGNLTAQTGFESNLPEFELSLLSFDFYKCDSNYRKNKVSEVYQYVERTPNKRELIYQALYDVNGVLQKKIIYDTVIRGHEVIEADRSDQAAFVVSRKINKNTILALGPVKYKPDYWMHFPYEWNGYRQIRKYWTDHADSVIRFKAVYTFSDDSSVLVKAYVNDQLIDSGRFPGDAATVFRNNYIEKYHTTKDTLYINDTIVLRKKQGFGNGDTTIIATYMHKELVHKVKREDFKGDTLQLAYNNIYEYTATGQLKSALIFDPGDFFAAKKVISYNAENNYDEDVGRIEAIYGPDDKVTEWFKFDRSGRLIENFFPYNPNHKEITKYHYYPNGLLKERTTIIEDIVRYKVMYTYKYY